MAPMEVALFRGRHVHQVHEVEEHGVRFAPACRIRMLPPRFGAPAALTGAAAAVPPAVGDMACTPGTLLPVRQGGHQRTHRDRPLSRSDCSAAGSGVLGLNRDKEFDARDRRADRDVDLANHSGLAEDVIVERHLGCGTQFGIDLRREFFHPATGFHKAKVSLLTRQGRRNTFPSLALVKPCGRAPKNSRPDPRPALATVVPQPVTMAG